MGRSSKVVILLALLLIPVTAHFLGTDRAEARPGGAFTKGLETQVITGTLFTGRAVTATVDNAAAVQDLDSRAFHVLPFSCDVKKLYSYIDEKPNADITITFKNGVGGTSMATHTHESGLTVPDAESTSKGSITARSFEEGEVLEINSASAATDVATVSYTVVCDARFR